MATEKRREWGLLAWATIAQTNEFGETALCLVVAPESYTTEKLALPSVSGGRDAAKAF